jgi:hypothetical protein
MDDREERTHVGAWAPVAVPKRIPGCKRRFDKRHVGKVVMFDQYIKDFDTIPGWMHRQFVDAILKLGEVQQWQGAVAEIGVYRGKLFGSMMATMKKGDKALAIDTFGGVGDDDGSGIQANREIFESNLKEWFPNKCNRLEIIERDSMKVHPYDIRQRVGPVRMFSVDGSHTYEAALHDCQLADYTLGQGGIIIVDDAFNPRWPAVMEGTQEALKYRLDYKPFAIGWNKMLIARKPYAESYRDALMDRLGVPWATAKLWGFDCGVFNTWIPSRYDCT